MGADNMVFQFASVGSAPQDRKYRGEPTRLEIGDRKHEVSVHIPEGDELDALWASVVRQAPFFDGYRKKSGRTIPIAVLTRST